MTNTDILNIAMQQSAIDSSCGAEDFISSENKVVISNNNDGARKYLKLPFLCDFTSYGSNIVASVSENLAETAKAYINQFPVEHCFETPNLHWFTEKLRAFGVNVCFMAEYFLPDLTDFPVLECKYETKVLTETDFERLYLPQWSNALSESRRHLDTLGVGAYDGGKLIGLAGCSADCESMWQIGIDVLPQYRRQGVASAITNQLAHEILKRDIVPFYCCAWANIKSVRNALKSGFVPSWVQMTVKPQEMIDDMNSRT